MSCFCFEPQIKAISVINGKETDITNEVNVWDLIEKITINDKPIDFKNNILNLNEFYNLEKENNKPIELNFLNNSNHLEKQNKK